MRVTYNAGQTWNQKLWEQWGNCLKTDQHQDFIAIDENNYSVAVEFKATDLHKSCFGKGKAGSLESELKEHYLGKFNEVWIVVADYQPTIEMQYVLSLAFKFRSYNVWVKWYNSQESAVKGVARALKQSERPVLNLPEYVNESDAPSTLARMLRQFPGVSDKIIDHYIHYTDFDMKNDGVFTVMDDFLLFLQNFRYENLHRLFYDWWNNGTEPKRNTLSVKKEAT